MVPHGFVSARRCSEKKKPSVTSSKPRYVTPPPPQTVRSATARSLPFPQNMFPAGSPGNSGQPGCTPGERERHSDLLESGEGLVDAYRHLHPDASAGTGTDTPGITWRGTAGNQFAEAGRYYGKVCACDREWRGGRVSGLMWRGGGAKVMSWRRFEKRY